MLMYKQNRKEQLMSAKASKVKQPADPDPTPITSSDPSPEVQSAARQEKKRVARNYGRSQTILAGNAEENKKTILGG